MAWSNKTLLFVLDVCIISSSNLYLVKSEGMCGEYDGTQSSECMEKFPSQFHINVVEGNNNLLRVDSRQVLIPDINFTCNGIITRWIIGAEWKGQSPAHTELQLWRKISMTENTFTKVSGTILMVNTENRSEVYEYILDIPLAFKEGDILGYFQPVKNHSELNLHLENSNRLSTYSTGLTVNDLEPPASGALFSLNAARLDSGLGYPIIAVRTDPADCKCGFMSEERVYALVEKNRLGGGLRTPFLERQLAIFPDITFTCSGEVGRWIMGGNFIRLGDEFLELHIWRPSGGGIYQRINGTIITPVQSHENNNVHEYTADPPLPFQPGDILGLLHPDYRETQLRLDYDGDGTSLFYVQHLSMSESGNSVFDISGEGVTTKVGVPLVSAGIVSLRSSPVSPGIIPTEATVATGGLQTLLPTSSVEEVSPGISSWIIFASVGVGGLVVLLIFTALIVISVVVCLKKRNKDHHINNTECNSNMKTYNVHHSPYVATSSSSGNDISTSKNDAYGIVHKETTTDTSSPCKCEGADAVYEDVTTSGAVERIHVSHNTAYGTTLHPMNNVEYDYI